uniref:Uncharacterized protein n=1 Tax=Panstrongylus lignarius TaxID=156445 RepID=A0A224XM93_9HEMI
MAESGDTVPFKSRFSVLSLISCFFIVSGAGASVLSIFSISLKALASLIISCFLIVFGASISSVSNFSNIPTIFLGFSSFLCFSASSMIPSSCMNDCVMVAVDTGLCIFVTSTGLWWEIFSPIVLLSSCPGVKDGSITADHFLLSGVSLLNSAGLGGGVLDTLGDNNSCG